MKFKHVITVLSIQFFSIIFAFASFAEPTLDMVSTPSNTELVAEENLNLSTDDFQEDSSDSTYDEIDSRYPESGSYDFPIYPGFSFYSVPDSLPSVSNSVDLSNVTLSLEYKTKYGESKYIRSLFDGDRHAILKKPSDFLISKVMIFDFPRSSLPPSGVYKMEFKYASDTSGFKYKTVILSTFRDVENAHGPWSNDDVPYSTVSGDVYVKTVIDLQKVKYFRVMIPVDGLIPPFGGYLAMSFTPTREQPSIVTAGGSKVQSDKVVDATLDTSRNTAAMVEKQDTIIDQIVDTTRTISDQLRAFWDQLAHEFTNIYNKLNNHHSELLQANRDNTDDIIDSSKLNSEHVIENQTENTTKMIENDNKNTDTIANGYDSSSLESSHNEFDKALTDFSEKEDQLYDVVLNKVREHSFYDIFGSVVAPLRDVSFFLEQIYNSIGLFSSAISFSFSLTIAMLFIGYYRFKGGA